MRGDVSAYSALGLQMGAEPDEIDRAYKRLIKLHHPDREGGDANRAAEINRAYRELRSRAPGADPLLFHDDDVWPEGSGDRGWVWGALILLVALGALLIATGPVTALIRHLSLPNAAGSTTGGIAAAPLSNDVMDHPLDRGAINQAIRDAMRLTGRHDDPGLLNASNLCHRSVRLKPSTSNLDRCAAFDDAVVELQNRDPVGDAGPFSQLAVSRRQWTAASALSNDYLAIDGRMDRIRLLVELTLAPPDPVVPQVQPDSNESQAD